MSEGSKSKTWADVAHSFIEVLVYIVFLTFLGFIFHECISCEKARDAIRHQQQTGEE